MRSDRAEPLNLQTEDVTRQHDASLTSAGYRARDFVLRMLIVGINYEPEETGIAPYTSGFARHLAKQGHAVAVVTGLPSYPQWRVLDEYRRGQRARERIEGVEVRRVWHYVPSKPSVAGRALYEASFALTGLAALTQDRPDVVLGVVPSLSGGVIARVAAGRFGVPYALIFQDVVSRGVIQSGVTGGRRLAGLVRQLEKWITGRAASVGIIAEGFRPHLESLGVSGRRIHRVRDWAHVPEPSLDPLAVRRQLGLPSDAIICLHAGNMGHKQGLANLVQAARVAASSDPPLMFVLSGDGNQRAELERQAQGLPNLRFLPMLDAKFFPSVLSAADILLVNQRASVTDMALPGKLTSYFHAGRPIVAAVAASSETGRELEAVGAGVVVRPEDPGALLTAIRALGADPERRELLGAKGSAHARGTLSADRCLFELEQWLMGAIEEGQGQQQDGP